MQRCFGTHVRGILRHNDLCPRITGFLRQKGWHVNEELSYSASGGQYRSDLMIAKDGVTIVVDGDVQRRDVELCPWLKSADVWEHSQSLWSCDRSYRSNNKKISFTTITVSQWDIGTLTVNASSVIKTWHQVRCELCRFMYCGTNGDSWIRWSSNFDCCFFWGYITVTYIHHIGQY
jgi:hypothetical protein